LQWQVARIWATDRPPSFREALSPRPRFDTPADTIITWLDREREQWFGRMNLSRPAVAQAVQAELDALQARLLRGLDEPERALAAHVILTALPRGAMMRFSMSPADRLEVLPDGSFAQTVNGVRVLLRPEQPFSPDGVPGHEVEARFCTASVEPGQLAAARDLWHRQLDVPVGSTPHWSLVAAAALPPLAWVGMALRRARLRRRRERQGLCRRCGYDLPATSPDCAASVGSRSKLGEC
jgi:hypothetical protein